MMTKVGIFKKDEKRSYRSIIYVDFNLIIRHKYRIVPIIGVLNLKSATNLWT
jgi:hypothetical protein